MSCFDTYGPFDLDRHRGEVSAEALDNFWSDAGDSRHGLCDAAGIYIVCTRHGKGPLKPWYVGQTHGRFESRFDQHQRNGAFTKLANLAPNGPLRIFLIPRVTDTGRLQRSTKRAVKAVVELEFALIGACLSLNPKLLNVSETRFLSRLTVPGFKNNRRGKPKLSAQALSGMLQRQTN